MNYMNPIKTADNRQPNGKFGPGNNANPNGRPKGKTLKEFAREYLMNLPDDEKLAYLKTLPQEIVWKMAEGNPHNTQDTKTDMDIKGIPILSSLLGGNENGKGV